MGRLELRPNAIALNITEDFVMDHFDSQAAGMQPGQYIAAPLFDLRPYSFEMRVYPNGETELDKGSGVVSAYLVRTDDADGYISGTVSIEIVSVNESVAYSCSSSKVLFFTDSLMLARDSQAGGSLAKVTDLKDNGCVPCGSLRLRVKFAPRFPDLQHRLPPFADKQMSNCIEAFGKMLSIGAHSDVVLVAEGREFRAHRDVLASRSPVFERMVNAKVADPGKISMPNIGADTMEKMLQFIYTGSCYSDDLDLWQTRLSADAELLAGRWNFEQHDEQFFDIIGNPKYLRYAGSVGAWSKGNPEQAQLEGELRRIGPLAWYAVMSNGSELTLRACRRSMQVLHVRCADEFAEERGWSISYARNKQILTEDQNMTRKWGQMLGAAVQYGIHGLAELCEQQLLDLLCVHTAALILETAIEHGGQGFKDKLFKQMTRNDGYVRAVKQVLKRVGDDLKAAADWEQTALGKLLKVSSRAHDGARAGYALVSVA